ncbi:MAG: phosphatidylglycerophosphatase A [candidate division KSB1 bacterium]|nr:phosphatidylglycerophosphatase A [candidate division KSB1 bacterium]MDZ7378348.1 phosphatidylglycerophosphatase A [candidate division KSB1 bacterium]MDZ7385988.1 phosphatidylglycerophosphatase A [candidate division KSB1 bacterium]MDZ7391749.1 phosphatidylglycerophosphatase A [candidate division KSB1 bacterium]MDZ7413987.1 phosphatidylglycerophosphatase A [candidate division KSB1 bacterium]
MSPLTKLCATGLYTGFSPVAPGTAGSFLALVLAFVLPRPGLLGWAAVLAVLIPLGIAAASRAERVYGHDASQINIDEVVGMLVALSGVPRTPAAFAAAFVLFRLLDVVKPFPVDELQELPAGWGVMADDLMAGLYTCLGLHVVLKIIS